MDKKLTDKTCKLGREGIPVPHTDFSRHLLPRAMSVLSAAANGDTSLCKQLIAYGKMCGYDVEEREPGTLSTPLHLAALFGHGNIIQLLLSHNSHNKADVNSRNRTDVTPATKVTLSLW